MHSSYQLQLVGYNGPWLFVWKCSHQNHADQFFLPESFYSVEWESANWSILFHKHWVPHREQCIILSPDPWSFQQYPKGSCKMKATKTIESIQVHHSSLMKRFVPLDQAVKSMMLLVIPHNKYNTKFHHYEEVNTIRDFCFMSLTIFKIDPLKKLKWAPTVYCFRTGRTQTFASAWSSTSNLRGRILKNISGPIATRADPTHSCSWGFNQSRQTSSISTRLMVTDDVNRLDTWGAIMLSSTDNYSNWLKL